MKPEIKDVSVTPSYATPVIAVKLVDADKINRELTKVILAREGATKGTDHSNQGGWQSTWDFLDWGGPAAKALLAAATMVADRFTCDRQGRPVKIDWKVNMWANVNRAGNANVVHTHPGSYWSGCYYVEDGGIAADHNLGGAFETQDPRGVMPAMYAPLLAYAIPGMLSVGASEEIYPESGKMLMFPPWLPHGVQPYRGTQLRISVAFNLSL